MCSNAQLPDLGRCTLQAVMPEGAYMMNFIISLLLVTRNKHPLALRTYRARGSTGPSQDTGRTHLFIQSPQRAAPTTAVRAAILCF